MLLNKLISMRVIIPWQELESATLNALLHDIVTRDGTDYGHTESSTDNKIQQAYQSLQKNTSVLLWDGQLESASLLNKEIYLNSFES